MGGERFLVNLHIAEGVMQIVRAWYIWDEEWHHFTNKSHVTEGEECS